MGILDEALTMGVASRERIFNANLRKAGGGENRPVRQALGLRENDATAKPPKFFSLRVNNLYRRIGNIATSELPVNDRDDLYKAWHEGSLRPEIEKLMGDYCDIWMESKGDRGKPGSHLYLAGQATYCMTDLHWSSSNHRAFIALQLEHLVFVRALTYNYNHPPASSSSQNDTPASHPSGDSAADKGATTQQPSVLDVVETSEIPKRRQYSPRKRSLRRSLSLLPEAESDDEGHLHTSICREGEASVSTRSKKRTRGTKTTHSFLQNIEEQSSTMIGLTHDLGDTDMGLPDTTTSIEDNHVGDLETSSHTTSAGSNHSQTDEEFATPIALGSRLETDKSQGEPILRAVSYPPLIPGPKEAISKSLRYRLRRLLSGEFCDHDNSHKTLKGGKSMWDKTEELNEIFLHIWESEEDRIREVMGETEYEDTCNVVRAWMCLCQVARVLGEPTEHHPSIQKTAPKLSYQEWVVLLGGDKFAQAENELSSIREKLEIFAVYEVDRKVFTDRLSNAFAVATEYTEAAQLYMRGVSEYTDNLLSWHVDFFWK